MINELILTTKLSSEAGYCDLKIYLEEIFHAIRAIEK